MNTSPKPKAGARTRDPVQWDRAARRLLVYQKQIVSYLRSRFPGLRRDQAEDIFAELLEKLDVPDSAKDSEVAKLLYRAVWRRGRDFVASETKRNRRERRWGLHSQRSQEGLYTDGEVRDRQTRKAREAWHQILLLLPYGEMRAVLTTWLRDTPSLDDYAAALSLKGIPGAEDRRAIQRAKDRVRKWLLRHKGDPEFTRILDWFLDEDTPADG